MVIFTLFISMHHFVSDLDIPVDDHLYVHLTYICGFHRVKDLRDREVTSPRDLEKLEMIFLV